MTCELFSAPHDSLNLGGHTHVLAADILFCEGDRNYTHVYFKQLPKLTLSVTLDKGDKKWEITPPADINTSEIANPVVANGLLYISTSKSFQALDAKTGAKKWEFTDVYHDNTAISAPFAPTRQATVADGVVYLCNNNYTYALDAATGKRIWRLVIKYTSPTSPPTPANGTVYVSFDSGIQAVDGASGAVLWSFKVDRSNQPCVVDKNGKVFRGSLTAGN